MVAYDRVTLVQFLSAIAIPVLALLMVRTLDGRRQLLEEVAL